jgi:hypothetical protein
VKREPARRRGFRDDPDLPPWDWGSILIAVLLTAVMLCIGVIALAFLLKLF